MMKAMECKCGVTGVEIVDSCCHETDSDWVWRTLNEEWFRLGESCIYIEDKYDNNGDDFGADYENYCTGDDFICIYLFRKVVKNSI